MKIETITNFLQAVGSTGISVGGEWVKGSCPFAPYQHASGRDTHPSFGIVLKAPHGYHCYACGARGKTIDSLVAELMHNHAKLPNNVDLARAINCLEDDDSLLYEPSEWKEPMYLNEITVKFWPEQYLSLFSKAIDIPRAVMYLRSRGLTKATINKLDMRYDHGKDLVCFPVRFHTGELVGMRGRAVEITEGSLRYYDYKYGGVTNTANTWLGEHAIDWLQPIAVVEGPFDYAVVSQVYPNVLCALGASISNNKVRRLDAAVKLFLWFDNDDAGKHAANYVKLKVSCACTMVPYPEGVKDPGSMTKKQIEVALAPFLA